MTGLQTTSEGWVSTYRLSHFAGQVIIDPNFRVSILGFSPNCP